MLLNPPRRVGFQVLPLLLGALMLIVSSVFGSEQPQVLTTIAEIRSARPEVIAGKMPAHVKGVATRAGPYELFIQDATDAIFIWRPDNAPEIKFGDLVEVVGNVEEGSFAPMIKATRIDVLGRGELPAPVRTKFQQLASGREDCHWVEVEGRVRVVERTSSGGLQLHLALDDNLLRIQVSAPTSNAEQRLYGSRVRVRGVVNGSRTPQRRLVEPVLWVEYTPATFVVLEFGPADVFSVPVYPTNTLLAYGSDTLSVKLTRVQGIATAWREPGLLFMRSEGNGFEVHLQHLIPVRPGDAIEAVGFPQMGEIQPVLENAVARVVSAGPPPPPTRVMPSDQLNFAYQADLVEIHGELRDLSRRSDALMLVVATENAVFNAELVGPTVSVSELPAVGARIAVTGIYHIDRLSSPNAQQVVTPLSFRLQLRSLNDIQVIAAPPWWTTQRLLVGLSILGGFLALTLGWIWSLNRRVDQQTRIILDETRKTARHEERSRIAREFHDTLEQQLAGTTIMLDAIAKMIAVQPDRAQDSLTTARAMLRHSLSEAQQSVLDLRDDEMVGGDLPSLIERSVRGQVEDRDIVFDFRFDDSLPEMDVVVKKQLLRIVQESVTNALKHAAPTRISVEIRLSRDRLDVRVTDDGCGFDPQNRHCNSAGKFGLIGLRERADKIRATLIIESAPGRGTSVIASLPRDNLPLST